MKRLTLVLVILVLLASSFWVGRITTAYSLFRKAGMTQKEYMEAIPEIAKMAKDFNPIDEDARTMYVLNDLVILSLLERNKTAECKKRIAGELAAYYHGNKSRPKPTTSFAPDYPATISRIEKLAETSEILRKAIAERSTQAKGASF